MDQKDLYSQLITLLDQHGAKYRLIDHKPEGRTEIVSPMRGNKLSQAAKCMVLIVKIGKKETKYVLGVVPGDAKIDFEAIRALMNASYVSFASADIAEDLAGSVVGTVLPFSFNPKLILIVDPSLLENAEIFFNAARLDRSMALKTDDYVSITKPRIENIAKSTEIKTVQPEDALSLQNLRHSCAHLLAAAAMELWPKAKRTIGPAIENGFYYDFDFGDAKVSEDDFPKIEAKMLELVETWKGFERKDVNKVEALTLFKNNEYKKELIEEFTKEGQSLTLYQSGSYVDLCRGGHCEHPDKELKYFKILSIAGAYWRGSEKNKMLTRIYGTCFPTKKELEKYLWQQEEAKKRDHRKLGKELDLFVFSDLVGRGLPLFTPRGTLIRDLLNDFSQGLRLTRGFQKVWIPHITKSELYKTSGHWDKFKDELLVMNSQETGDVLVMKPMNCPHHQQIYASKPRSYKDLPIKYMETTAVYRDEKAGEMIGLSRVRSVTQDDSHTFCTPEQIEVVYSELIDVIKEFYSALGMKYKARLSFRDPSTPEKYLGEPVLWDKAQKILLSIAKASGLDYYEAPGEAAFYGPKIDIMVTDSIGREWQLATPQLDFVQPKRFGLTYVDQEGKKQTPVMIHFALMGSLERFLSVYIEHTAGVFPAWLAPVQVVLIPIAQRHTNAASQAMETLVTAGLRVEIDDRNESMQGKIRDATLQKVPYMGIIGDKETANNTIAVRTRSGEDLKAIDLKAFISRLQEEIEHKS